MPAHPRSVDRPAGLRRRDLLPALGREILTLAGLLRGGRAFRLSDLGKLPDEKLARLAPVVIPGFDLVNEGRHIYSRNLGSGASARELPARRENVLVCGWFDGQTTLDEIGRRLAAAQGWDSARGFAHARTVFLSLVRRGICIPANPLEE